MNDYMFYISAIMSQRKFAKHALHFKVLAECSKSKARVGMLELPHHIVDTPVFMPVGTQVKISSQLDCFVI